MCRIAILVCSLLLAAAVHAANEKPALDADPNLVGWSVNRDCPEWHSRSRARSFTSFRMTRPAYE